MARFFNDASQEYLELDSAPITATPFTMACWFNSNDIGANQGLMWLGDKDVADHYWAMLANGAGGGDPIAFQAVAGGGAANAVTSTGFSADTWHHACGVAVSAIDRAVFIDGGSRGTNVTSRTPLNADRITIGGLGDSTPTLYMSGAIAEAAFWNVALSDAEVALLAKGFSPLFIRPQNLVAYWPLIRDDDNDLIGGFDLTAFNTPTVATHPPLIVYPTIPTLPFSTGIQTLSPTGIVSTEAFGSPDISLRRLGVTGIASVEAIGVPSIIKRQGAVVIISDQKPILVTPGFTDYKVRLKNQSGSLVAEFDSWRSLSFSHLINAPGSCRLEIDALDSRADLFELDGQIEVWRRNLDVGLDWYIEWEGFHRTGNDLVQQDNRQSFVSYSAGYLDLLRRRHIMYLAGTSQSAKSGVGETVIKSYVDQNAGLAALIANGRLGNIDGNFSGLTIETDQGFGDSWEGARAFKNLLTTIADIAIETNVDVELVGTGAATYQFKVHDKQIGLDRTTVGLTTSGLNAAGNVPVIFSLAFGNMAMPLLSINRSTEANAIFVLGQGEEDNREIVFRQDDIAIADSPWNQIELVKNATQESTTSGLNSVGDEALVEHQKKETINFIALQLESIFYGKDYKWGDLITARYKDLQFNKKIVDVRIVVSKTQEGEQINLEFADIP